MGSTKVQAPTPIDPAKVGADSLATQLRLAPDVYAGEATYRPRYAALDQQIMGDSLLGTNGSPGLLDMYSQTSRSLGNDQVLANTQQRQADINDVTNLGGAARAAYVNANPDLARSMGGLSDNIMAQRKLTMPGATPEFAGAGNLRAAQNAEAGNLGAAQNAEAGNLGPAAMAQTSLARSGRLGRSAQMQSTDASAGSVGPAAMYGAAGLTATGVGDSALTPGLVQNAQGFAAKTPLQSMLEQQAGDSLLNGGNLTATELAKAQQDVRGAYAARGLNDSNGSIGAEILNTDAARTAKMNAARTFAQGVDASGQATLNQNRNFAQGVEGNLQQQGQFNAGAANNAAAQNAEAENLARSTNAGAANQFGLTQFGTNAQLAGSNAAARNAAAATNAGAANQFALTRFGQNAQTELANAAARNATSNTNAGAANNFALTRYGQNAATSATNAGAANQFSLTQFGQNAAASATNAGAQNQFALTQFGTNADLARSNSALGLQAQLANMDYSRANTNDQFAREFQLAQMQQSQAQDPFQMVLGRSAAPAMAQGATQGAGYTQGAGAKLFDPFNSSLMNIYSGNQANQLAASTASANNKSALLGAGIGAVGTMGGAAMGLMVF